MIKCRPYLDLFRRIKISLAPLYLQKLHFHKEAVFSFRLGPIKAIKIKNKKLLTTSHMLANFSSSASQLWISSLFECFIRIDDVVITYCSRNGIIQIVVRFVEWNDKSFESYVIENFKDVSYVVIIIIYKQYFITSKWITFLRWWSKTFPITFFLFIDWKTSSK